MVAVIDEVDFAHTPQARRRREEKARRVACWCWDRAVTSADITASDAAARRRIAREAGVPCPRTLETWARVQELLDAKTAWAARHPAHPAAAQPLARDYPTWVAAKETEPAWPAPQS